VWPRSSGLTTSPTQRVIQARAPGKIPVTILLSGGIYILNECEVLGVYKEVGRLVVSWPLGYLSSAGRRMRENCLWA
jgi:hypothetical protein